MDPKERDLLERTFELSRENNRMLRSLRSSARWGKFIRIVYWIAIIVAALWLYQYLQPFIDEVMDIFNQAVDLKNSFKPSE